MQVRKPKEGRVARCHHVQMAPAVPADGPGAVLVPLQPVNDIIVGHKALPPALLPACRAGRQGSLALLGQGVTLHSWTEMVLSRTG